MGALEQAPDRPQATATALPIAFAHAAYPNDKMLLLTAKRSDREVKRTTGIDPGLPLGVTPGPPCQNLP